MEKIPKQESTHQELQLKDEKVRKEEKIFQWLFFCHENLQLLIIYSHTVGNWKEGNPDLEERRE